LEHSEEGLLRQKFKNNNTISNQSILRLLYRNISIVAHFQREKNKEMFQRASVTAGWR